MNYEFLQPWHLFLPRQGGHVIALFGGGGKTSLLAAWSGVLGELRVPVLVTTTTRTEPLAWQGLVVRSWQEFTEGPVPASAPAVAIHAGRHPDGKWQGLTPEQVAELGRRCADRVIIVEADGSAGLPVKLHRPGEPVWPLQMSLAVAVMGLGAVGRPAGEILHRLGRAAVPACGDITPQTVWDWDHMFALLTGPGGYLDRVPAGVPPLLVLTQTGGLADGIGLFSFLDRVMSRACMPIVVLCELSGKQPRFRTVCLAEGDSNEGK
jgi:probable selenium-dependent hydroxylase accessory protein YqeC